MNVVSDSESSSIDKEGSDCTSCEEEPISECVAKRISEHQFKRPHWVPDHTATSCATCHTSFNLVTRKHHCRACGLIVCKKCSPYRHPLLYLGYLNPQRICVSCATEKSSLFVPTRSRESAPNIAFQQNAPPIQRSESLVFAPPGSFMVNDHNSDDKIHYFSFTMKVVESKKIYKDIQVALSHDRVMISASGPTPSFHTLFYRDILVIQKNKKNPLASCIFWFPWIGTEKTRSRELTRILALHHSQSERDKFHKTLTHLLDKASFLTPDQRASRHRKKLLILINPHAGAHKAWDIYNSVAPLFTLAKLRVETVYLESTKQAEDIIGSINLQAYSGIVCCGGDGVLHHVWSALMKRKNYSKFPVFCIPAGHGVGFAVSVLATASPVSAAFSIAKGFRRPVDIIEVNHGSKLMCYGCLLVAWGMVADVEFNTAKWRFIGPIRYRLGAVGAALNPTFYKLRLSYLPATDQSMTFCTGEGCVRCTDPNNALLTGLDSSNSIAEPQWVVEEGEFLMLTACNLTDTTVHHRVAPYAHASDGCIDLVFIKNVSYRSFFDLFVTIADGSFVNNPDFYLNDKLGYIKVKSFRVETLSGPVPFSVDGIPYVHESIVECNILPSAGVMG